MPPATELVSKPFSLEHDPKPAARGGKHRALKSSAIGRLSRRHTRSTRRFLTNRALPKGAQDFIRRVRATTPRVHFWPLIQGLLAAVSKADLVATNLIAHSGEDQMKLCDPTHLLTRRASLGYLLPRQG